MDFNASLGPSWGSSDWVFGKKCTLPECVIVNVLVKNFNKLIDKWVTDYLSFCAFWSTFLFVASFMKSLQRLQLHCWQWKVHSTNVTAVPFILPRWHDRLPWHFPPWGITFSSKKSKYCQFCRFRSWWRFPGCLAIRFDVVFPRDRKRTLCENQNT